MAIRTYVSGLGGARPRYRRGASLGLLAVVLVGCGTVPNRQVEPVLTPFHYHVGDYQDTRQTSDLNMPYRLSKDKLLNRFVTTLNRDLFSQEPATLYMTVTDFYSELDKSGGGRQGKLFLQVTLKAHDSRRRPLAEGQFQCTVTGGEPFQLGSFMDEMVRTGTFTNREPLAKLWDNLLSECLERLAGDFGTAVLTGDGVRPK